MKKYLFLILLSGFSLKSMGNFSWQHNQEAIQQQEQAITQAIQAMQAQAAQSWQQKNQAITQALARPNLF